MRNPTFDLNAQTNTNAASDSTFYTKEYKVKKYNSLYGYGISCDQTNSNSGWDNTNSAIRFREASYQADTGLQSGLIIFSIDEYTFSEFTTRTMELLNTRNDSTTQYIVRVTIENSSSNEAFASLAVSFSVPFIGTIQTSVLYFTNYIVGTPLAFSWTYLKTSPTTTVVYIYFNGILNGSLTVANTPTVNDILIGRNTSGTTSPSLVGYTIYDVMLFDGIGGTSFGAYLSNPSSYTQIYKQSQSGRQSSNRRSWLLGSLPSGPVINTNLMGLQATFDYNNRLVRYPRTINFELQK